MSLDGHGRRIDQITPTFELRDAIADEALLVRDSLRAAGFESSIYSPMIAPNGVPHALPLRTGSTTGADLVLYHFGIGCASADAISRLECRRVLWYHNLTPSTFFRPYAPVTADLLDVGRRQLERIADRFDSSIADSAYNARELRVLTRKPVDVVAFPIDWRRFGTDAPSRIPRAPIRWLSVGRIAPSKGLLRLIRSFAPYAVRYPESQLVLAGAFAPADAFYLRVVGEIERLGLTGRIVVTGSIDNAELASLYRKSDVYMTLSEHEGFCVPVVEAMFFDLPVIASDAGALPETLGDAGLLVKRDATAEQIASLADLVLTDASVRTRLLAAQRERRRAFGADRIGEQLSAALERVLAPAGAIGA